jgi:hypothetical protein
MRFDKIGNEQPNDYTAFQFAIEQYGAASSIKDFFAPAEFIKLSDSQRLSRNAFERMQSGRKVEGNMDLFTAEQPDAAVQRSYRFEQMIIDGPDFFVRPADRDRAGMEQADYDTFVKGNAVGRSVQGRQQELKRRENQQAVHARAVAFSLVDQSNLRPFKLNGKALKYESEAEALQALRTLQFRKPQLGHRLRVAPATETETL